VRRRQFITLVGGAGASDMTTLAAMALCLWMVGPCGMPAALAQSYPSGPITVIVPFPAGGPSDVVARILTETMGKSLGATMVIDNVGGAGGTLGTARVAAARPDGYTLLAGSMGSHISAPVLMPNVRYDSERDFVPIGFTANSPAVIVARKDFPAKDLTEFVEYLKSNSDKVRQAHGGIGSSSHMACLLFDQAAGLKPSLSRHRTGDERSHGRPCRLFLRAGGERRRTSQGRRRHRLCRFGKRASRCAP
jgi:tripartite-type tricarboxylate transporter receptor subunit TctC